MTDSEMSVALAPTIGMSTNASPFFSTPRSSQRTCAKISGCAFIVRRTMRASPPYRFTKARSFVA